MLIDFTVENYRSIKEPVTLSAIAQAERTRPTGTTKRHIKPDSEIAPASPIEGRGFELLPVLGIFGANASGKSNLINALDDLLGFMAHGILDNDLNLSNRCVPFKLATETVGAPTRFEMRVAAGGIIFTYSLAIGNGQILHERLDHLPAPPKRVRLLFERRWDADAHKYRWKNGEDFIGAHTQLEETLADQEPFMSFLMRRLEVPVVRPLKNWLFPRGLKTNPGEREFNTLLAALYCQTDPATRTTVSDIVRRFDTGISDLIIEMEEPVEQRSWGLLKVMVLHRTRLGQVQWPLEEESAGTQRLFILATRLVMAFHSGTLVLVDELGSNIHPNITREIVRLFQSPKTNPKRAQLIFTSHDNTLQRGNLLRRDEIWFTQKREDGSTDLYPLTDFKPRNDLAIDKAYLDGRFGAVPILLSEEDLIPILEARG